MFARAAKIHGSAREQSRRAWLRRHPPALLSDELSPGALKPGAANLRRDLAAGSQTAAGGDGAVLVSGSQAVEAEDGAILLVRSATNQQRVRVEQW